MSKDYYKILGVDKGASQDEIKKAFHKLAHQHHPDKEGGDEKKFKEVNEAYQVLSNPEKRKKYDQFGSNFDQAGGFGGGGFNWQDFAQGGGPFSGGFGTGNGAGFDFGDLGDLFGDFFGGGQRGGGRKTKIAKDIEMEMSIDFKDAVFGTKRKIKLYKNIVCSGCHGSGAEKGTEVKTCTNCSGTGRVIKIARTMLGNIQTSVTCHICNGEGKIIEKKCRDCGGIGTQKGDKEIEIDIPAGIDNGQTLKVPGAGEAGPKSERNGDLYITFKVKKDPRFEREGENIFTKIEILFSQAVLGAKINVETIDGEVNLKIPEGTPSGKVFKLKGKGVSRLNGYGRGDHFVTVDVVIPTKLTKDQKKLLKELSENGL